MRILTGLPNTVASGDAWPFSTVQQHVANLIKDKVIVGHSLWFDLSGIACPI